MKFRLALALALAAGLTTLTIVTGQDPPPQQRRPKLVVMLVVDQLRTDYIENYGQHFTAGLKRLRDEGAWFRGAAYPYLNTVTCAGHSTIGTGAQPYRHGLVLNRWWDRETARATPCTEDLTAKNIRYSGTSRLSDSAARLLVPTLAEVLRAEAGARTAVMSLKGRSAIGLNGKGQGAVTWIEGLNWTTSSAFASGPVDWVRTFVDGNPVRLDLGRTWTRRLPPESYTGDDEARGERFPAGWSAVFPHPVGKPEAQLEAQWTRTPLADEYLARMAIHALDALTLGQGTGTDLLGVSFSTLDLVGHQFGPHSHEVQDIVFHLDVTIGRLLDALDARLGPDGYVLGLSSDHGVSPLTERSGGGRHLAAEISATVQEALTPILGAGKHVAHTEYTDIYFAPGVADRIRNTPQAWPAIREALLALPGITHAFRSEDLASAEARTSTDPARRAAALSHHPQRSGDLIVIPKEYWLLSSAAATHGTLHGYDQRVPVLFFGAGVKPGVSDAPATPADVAPTLAALAGVRFEAPDGKVLLRPELP